MEICFLFKRFLLRAFYVQRATSGLDVEFGVPLLQVPTKASDKELRRLIIQMPLERFRIQNYFEYNENDDTVQIAPQLWQELRYQERKLKQPQTTSPFELSLGEREKASSSLTWACGFQISTTAKAKYQGTFLRLDILRNGFKSCTTH